MRQRLLVLLVVLVGSDLCRAADEIQVGLPPKTLTGVVVDRHGQPIAGATVDVWTWVSGDEATTDRQGHFQIENLPADERVEVLVTKAGFSPAYNPQQATGIGEQTFVLDDRYWIEGIVTSADGKPVVGAEVRGEFGPFELDGGMVDSVALATKSDADGRYRLYAMPQHTYDVRVTQPDVGVVRQSQVGFAGKEVRQLNLRLAPGVRLEAIVVDSVTGQPVPGFVLFTWRPPRLAAVSDAEGRIIIDQLLPGKMECDCGGGEPETQRGNTYYRHGPFGRWWSTDALHEHQRKHIEPDRDGWQRNFDGLTFDLQVGMSPVKIEVEQGVTISGLVTDPDGKPVAGATVAPARTGSANSLTGDTRYSVTTDADGRYRSVLPASGATRYNFIAHDGEYDTWRKWANGSAEPLQTKPGQVIEHLNLQLTRPAVVRGIVRRPGGAGVAGQRIEAHPTDGRSNRYYVPATTSDENGRFELKFVSPGEHIVQNGPGGIIDPKKVDTTMSLIYVDPGETLEGIEIFPRE